MKEINGHIFQKWSQILKRKFVTLTYIMKFENERKNMRCYLTSLDMCTDLERLKKERMRERETKARNNIQ